jgi:choline dehydrogenase-like flavoprotein
MTLLAEPKGTHGGIVDGRHLAGERHVRADVCVIGSGAGGAPVAALLAQSGARVVVLEDGQAFHASQLTARPRDMTATLYRDAGQFSTLGTPPIMLPTGRALGGTTLVNSGTCFRAPQDLQQRWLDHLRLDDLTPYYERVERTLHVRQVTPDLAGANARVAKRGADALGWSGDYLHRNARGCVGSGVCAFGCPTGAKQHAGVTYMEDAHAAGAITYTATRARRIAIANGRAHAVEARTRGGGTVKVTAGTVVLAAGTLHTPLLLAASGVAHPDLGRHLTIHPCTAAWAIMDEVVDMARGVPQSYGIDEFADEGLMLEGIAGPPDYLAMAVPYSGDAHRELMMDYRRVAQFGLMLRETSRGSVKVGSIARRGGRPLVRYDLNDADARTVKRGVERLAELLFAAGARRVILPTATVPELRDGDLGPLRAATVRPADLKLMAFHPLGTAQMGRVTDADGALDGVAGLHLADGSIVPGPLGVNPQLTIFALATRLADRLAALPKGPTTCRS